MFNLVSKLIGKPLVLLLAILSLASCTEDENPLVQELPVRPAVSELLIQVNRLRAEGCNCGGTYFPPAARLVYDQLLEKAALRHSQDMSRNKHFDHVGTDGSSYIERIEEAGYDAHCSGENIAYGYSTVVAVMNGWKTSPGHCKLLMDAKSTEMGAASVGKYWTLVLAKPRSGN